MQYTSATVKMLAVVSLSLLPLIAAHGRMTWPLPRLLPGDASNGYTYARTASTDPCQNLPEGPVLTPAFVGGAARVDYVITAAHKGGCTIFLDKRDGSGWVSIGSDPNCGASAHSGTINVEIPPGNYSAVLRWYYETNNYSGELFNNCADIIVSSTGGTSQHESAVESLQPTLSSSTTLSPTSTSEYTGILRDAPSPSPTSKSCQTIGAMRCVDNNPQVFQICAPGDTWVTMNCPAPNVLQCTYIASDSVVCGWKPSRR